MKLDLQLYGINVSATQSGVTLVLNGTALRLSSAEFGALAHALASVQEILLRSTYSGHVPEAREHAVESAIAPVEASVKLRGRPPKSSAAATFTPPPVAGATTTAISPITGKKRGRPPKNPQVSAPITAAIPVAAAALAPTGAAAPKKRGRPPKNAGAAPVVTAATAEAAAPRKRGRPPKNAAAVIAATQAAPEAPRKRGRPPKNAAAVTAATQAAPEAPRKRGRPPKNLQVAAAAIAANAAPKRRGRPPKNPGIAVAAKAKPSVAAPSEGAKRGPGRPRTDGTAVGAPRLVDIVDTWMAEHPGPKSMVELANAAEANQWVETAHAAEYLERHVPRAPHLFVRMADGRFRRRADKTPVEAPKAAKVLRRRGHDEIAIVRVEAPGT